MIFVLGRLSSGEYHSIIPLDWNNNVYSYGTPIPIDRYLSDYLDPHEDSTPHAAVERLTAEINSRMLELTIDAPDW